MSMHGNGLSSFLENFDWNRNYQGIEYQLQNSIFLEKSKVDLSELNNKLSNMNYDKPKFLEKLKTGSTDVSDAENRFKKFINAIQAKDNAFFDLNNIKQIFLNFAWCREQLENSTLEFDKKTIELKDLSNEEPINKDENSILNNSKNKLHAKEQILINEETMKFVSNVIDSSYKLLAVYYFGGMLSAENLDRNLKRLESIQSIIYQDVNPNRFEIFFYVIKKFFQSLIDLKVKKISITEAAGEIKNRRRRCNINISELNRVVSETYKDTKNSGDMQI